MHALVAAQRSQQGLLCSRPCLAAPAGRRQVSRGHIGCAQATHPFRSASDFLRSLSRPGRSPSQNTKPPQKSDAKSHTNPQTNQALPTSTLASVDGASLFDTVLSGSLHAVLLVVWIGALGLTLTAALRFVSVSQGPATVRVVATEAPLVARALAALVGGLLRLVARVLARNVDLMRLASLGTVTFLINSVTHI